MRNQEDLQCKSFAFHLTFLPFASEDQKANATENSTMPQSITFIL